jgi:glycosyltransferase involved in cell wall biosynthesis
MIEVTQLANLRSDSIRPKIGVDFHTFDGIFQGSRSHVIGLFREVIKLAPEIDFVFFLGNPDRLVSSYPEFRAPNVRLVKMPHRPGPVRLAFQLPWLQWREKLDLLHTQYRLPFFPMGPCACTIHDVLFESHPEYFPRFFTLQSKLTFRAAAHFASLLFTVSEYSRNEISIRYGIDKSRIGILYNGVDTSRFFSGNHGEALLEPFGLARGEYILMVGRLEPRKNHVRLIEAYARLGNGVPPLVCVGQRDFGYAAALEAANRLGVSSRVHFLENIGDEVLPALMRNSRLVAFPAIAEGFGMPVAEALASGVPVVTSNSTSMPEVAGGAAVLVDPLDINSIASGLAKVLADPELSACLVANAQQQVAKFNWKTSAQTLVNAYRGHFAERYVEVGRAPVAETRT